MAGSLPWSNPSPMPPPPTDPNLLLQQIDRKTTELLTWVKYGMVAVIVLLLLVAIGL